MRRRLRLLRFARATRAHGHAGMLYRGHYLDQALVRGMRLAIDAQWLERCPAGRPQDVKQ